MNTLKLEQLTPFLTVHKINRIAVKTRFKVRKPRKITPSLFLKTWILSVGLISQSYLTMAASIAISSKKMLSKQAMALRTSSRAVKFLKELLKQIIIGKDHCPIIIPDAIKRFSRVILQDSTCVPLPDSMYSVFPGSKNQSGKQHATLKIQASYNILNGDFLYFDISSFRVTDQAASSSVLSYMQPNDLIIRDLGYFSLNVFNKIDNHKAFYISRFTPRINLWKKVGVNFIKVDVTRILNKYNHMDSELYVGNNKQLKARIIALPVPEKIANKRRREAKNNRDKRLNHSDEYYHLLGWEIFITNIPKEHMSPTIVGKTYFIRWNIEIIFKAWKSYFSLKKVPKASKEYCELFLYARLIHAIIFNYWFIFWKKKAISSGGCFVSILKMAILMPLIASIQSLPVENEFMSHFVKYYGVYDKRKRLNSMQQIEALT